MEPCRVANEHAFDEVTVMVDVPVEQLDKLAVVRHRALAPAHMGQSEPHIIRSGAASTKAAPNGTASSQRSVMGERRLPFESISHQPWFWSRSMSHRSVGEFRPAEKS